MSQDTLSDVLRSVRLRSAVFYYVSCDGNWVAEAPASRAIAAAVMPDAEHVIEYHVLTAGECWAGIVGEPAVKMKRGDIVLLPQGDAHVVSSAPGMRADPDVSGYFDLGRAQRPFRIHHDGSRKRCKSTSRASCRRPARRRAPRISSAASSAAICSRSTR